MTNQLRRAAAAMSTAALVAAPLTVLTAAPASAADREFRYAGAEVEYDVEKDDGRFEVEVEVEDAQKGSRWVVTLWHDGKRYYKRTRTADSDGEFEIERNRPNTKGKDVFKMKIKRVGGPPAKTRVIKRR